MSNFPHSTASSFSTSPYIVQSNLEQLITRSRTHPHARRPSQSSEHHGAFTGGFTPIHADGPGEEGQDGDQAGQSKSRRPSEYTHGPRMQTVREASRDGDDALMFDASDDEEGETDERARMLASRRKSRRSSAGSKSSKRGYGTMSEPFAFTPAVGGHGRRKSEGKHGNSRSRSAARTPPRHTPVDGQVFSDEEVSGNMPRPGSPSQASVTVSARGRERDSRRLSHSASISRRRMSISTRFADDSSGDEGGDVARGLVATGAAGMFGGAATGLGMTPAAGPVAASVLDLDPAEELDAEDLQVKTDEQGHEIRDWSQALRAEMIIVAKSSIPVFFTQLAEWSLVLSSVISIGHLGTTELAASSLASMTASVSSFSILQGLATALDTLLPAAWTSSDPTRVGLWTQRMAVVMAFSTIPMYVMWWNVERILLALGQEPDVAYLASIYLRYLSFGIPGYGGNVIVKKYLQAQNLMNIPTYVLFIVAPLNIFFNYLFVWGPDFIRLGFVGGAVATSLSYTITFILAGGWAILYGPAEARYPWKFSHVFAKLGTVTSLGLAGTIMVSSEWWAWEACALAASLLGPVSLAAQSVLLSTTSTFFQVPAALGIASAVRTGNLLGAGRGWEAKWASRACLFLSIFFAAINSAICLIFRKNWGYLFNGDPEVVGIVASIMPYIALFQISDGVAATAGAVLRALGLHTTGALINLTSYYIIGLPFGLWLTFQPNLHLGLIGLWIGLSIALGYASIVSFVLVWRANWVRAVERVRERLGLPAQGVVGEDGKWEDTIEGEGGRDGEGLDRIEEEDSEGSERSAGSAGSAGGRGREEREVGERTRLLNGNQH